MITAKKVRLKPTPEQEVLLWKSAGTARFIYNWTLNRQEEQFKSGGKFISDNDLRKEVTVMKKTEDLKWIGDVSNNVAKQAVKDAYDAYKKFFKGLAEKPRFKSRRKSKASFYNDSIKLKIKDHSALIEKVGWIKTAEQLPIGVNYSNPRISHDGKYWYLSVGIEQEFKEESLSGEVIGIDLGIKDLAICSDGQVFKNINKTKEVRKIDKRLRRLQRSVSRKYEMNKEGSRFVKTSNTIKVEKQIRHLHRRLANIRNNHLHQSTHSIVKTKPCKVVMEDLNVTGMMKNRHLAKAIQKQKLYEFTRQMKYKCEKYGIEFMQVDRFFPSSKTCSSCGTIKKDLKLSDRTFTCTCGLKIDRDRNASLNLAKAGQLTV
ncbi:RNA-guided endonuclease InsQ/TnpB family protein [Domibacillus enclensis]|uniref:Transposase n=1 Tax=Domibacillus enclensis TaxID=1017273 RepID=A0A1N7BD20_9BACI|nr:RNA-guided endonuclease TnpB family protein [Domibacillus enclensis]OXS74682.1 transposase [Domibacillus enclensis]SIR49237.1 putative transposase [Domibacillus enclensis]